MKKMMKTAALLLVSALISVQLYAFDQNRFSEIEREGSGQNFASVLPDTKGKVEGNSEEHH